MNGIERIAAERKRQALQDECSHTYKLPWTGCGYLQCSKCGKRTDNDD